MSSAVGIERSIVSAAALKIVSQIISWSATIYALRVLNPIDYGVMATVVALTGLLLPFADIPLMVSLIRKRVISPTFHANYLAYCRLTGLAVAVLGLALASIYAFVYGNKLVIEVALINCISCLLITLKTVPEAMLLRAGKITQRAICLFVEAIVIAVSLFIFVHFHFGVFSLALSPCLGMVGRVLAVRWFSEKGPDAVYSAKRMVRFFKWTLPGVVNETIQNLGGNAPVLVASFVLQPVRLGIFSTALYFVTTIVGKVMQVINPALIALTSKTAVSKAEAARRVSIGLGYVALFSLPVFFGLAFVANDVVKVVLGSKWTESGFAISAIALIMPLRMSFEFIATALRARGFERLLTKLQLMHLIPTILGCLGGGYGWGFKGVVLGFAFSYSVFAVVNMVLACRSLNVRMVDILRNMRWPLIGVCVMVSALVLSESLLLNFESALRLTCNSVGGAILFLPFAWLARRQLL